VHGKTAQAAGGRRDTLRHSARQLACAKLKLRFGEGRRPHGELFEDADRRLSQ
jgi:hypothetical protein